MRRSTLRSKAFVPFPLRMGSTSMAIFSAQSLRKTFPMLASRKGFPKEDMHNSTALVKVVFPRNSVCWASMIVRKASAQTDDYSYKLICWLFRGQRSLEYVRQRHCLQLQWTLDGKIYSWALKYSQGRTSNLGSSWIYTSEKGEIGFVALKSQNGLPP